MVVHVAVVLGDPRLPYAYAPGGVFGKEELRAVEALRAALETLDGFRFTYLDEHATLIDALRSAAPDLVLNLCDVGYENVWTRELEIPALCGLVGVPCTGAGPVGIVLSNDKALMTAAAERCGVPVPRSELVSIRDEPIALPTEYPAIIKPNVSGGSAGITEKSVVHDDEEARACLAALRQVLETPEVIYQELLLGAEYTVGVLGNPGEGLEILPPLEVGYEALDASLPPILTHGSKADPSSPYWTALEFRRAALEPEKLERIAQACRRVFARLELRDYGRFDFRDGEDGVPRLIDANVNPTWYAGGKLSVMAEWAGYGYAALLERILRAALARAGGEA